VYLSGPPVVLPLEPAAAVPAAPPPAVAEEPAPPPAALAVDPAVALEPAAAALEPALAELPAAALLPAVPAAVPAVADAAAVVPDPAVAVDPVAGFPALVVAALPALALAGALVCPPVLVLGWAPVPSVPLVLPQLAAPRRNQAAVQLRIRLLCFVIGVRPHLEWQLADVMRLAFCLKLPDEARNLGSQSALFGLRKPGLSVLVRERLLFRLRGCHVRASSASRLFEPLRRESAFAGRAHAQGPCVAPWHVQHAVCHARPPAIESGAVAIHSALPVSLSYAVMRPLVTPRYTTPFA
jgi:hypothetical protein